MTHPTLELRRCSLLAVLLAVPVSAQTQFAESTKAHFPFDRSLARGVAVGDVDGDGDLDVFFAVSTVGAPLPSRLYRNDGNHRFTDVSAASLPPGLFQHNSAAFGDVDGDGDQDLVAADAWQDRLYLNDGAGHFTDATFGHLPSELVDTRRLALGDLDGDGDLDLVRVNYRLPTVWLNDGSGVFTDVSATHVPATSQATWDVALGDVDGDGDLDVAIAAQSKHWLWLNDGTGKLTDVTGVKLPGPTVQSLGVEFGDVDGDQDLDLVFANWNAAPTLYLNDGTGTFTDATAGRLPSLVDWVWNVDLGDADNDGDLDIAFGVVGQSRLYANDGSGTFTDVTTARLPDVVDATIQLAFADLDGDQDLDLVSANTFQENRLCYNDGGTRFVDATPTRFEAKVAAPYAIAVGDVDGDGDPDVVVGDGDAGGYNESSRLMLNDGNGFVGAAPPGSFPTDSDDTRAVVLGDVDGNGTLDAVLGIDGAPPKLYLNAGAGVFIDASMKLPAAAARTRGLVFGDIDGDLDLDLVIGDLGSQSRIFLNSGGSFTDATAGRMPPAVLETRAVALADVDQDGDLDLVLGNGQATGEQNRLYLNDGQGHFADVTATHMPVEAAPTSSLAFGDVDGDGDLDIVLGNDSPTFGAINSLYLNDGSGHFVNRWWQLVYESHRTFSVALGDVDEDGDLDLVCGDHSHWNKLQLNDGTGMFSDASPQRMPVELEDTTAVALVDMDGDLDLDLISAGNGWTRAVVALYPNHHRQIWSKRLAHVGETYVLDVHGRSGYATAPQIALVVLGLQPAQVAMPPLGTLRVDPAGMVVLPTVAIAPPLGVASVSLPIPAIPALAGIHLYFQAVVASGTEARFTNMLDERIGGF